MKVENCLNCGAKCKAVKKINSKIVCKNCYSDFLEKQRNIFYKGAKFDKSEQWWNNI